MPTRLADLDELVLSCRNKASRELIREAVLCYKAGAFRSAIVNTWIAVAFDLVEKLRELALGGDKQADQEVNHFELIQGNRDFPGALKFERELLNKCRDQFELISALEFTDLERLAEDRNRCAHPNLVRYNEIYVPNAELVRTHLRSAIEHVLQQPPRVGKAALEQLYRDVQADYFPIGAEDH